MSYSLAYDSVSGLLLAQKSNGSLVATDGSNCACDCCVSPVACANLAVTPLRYLVEASGISLATGTYTYRSGTNLGPIADLLVSGTINGSGIVFVNSPFTGCYFSGLLLTPITLGVNGSYKMFGSDLFYFSPRTFTTLPLVELFISAPTTADITMTLDQFGVLVSSDPGDVLIYDLLFSGTGDPTASPITASNTETGGEYDAGGFAPLGLHLHAASGGTLTFTPCPEVIQNPDTTSCCLTYTFSFSGGFLGSGDGTFPTSAAAVKPVGNSYWAGLNNSRGRTTVKITPSFPLQAWILEANNDATFVGEDVFGASNYSQAFWYAKFSEYPTCPPTSVSGWTPCQFYDTAPTITSLVVSDCGHQLCPPQPTGSPDDCDHVCCTRYLFTFSNGGTLQVDNSPGSNCTWGSNIVTTGNINLGSFGMGGGVDPCQWMMRVFIDGNTNYIDFTGTATETNGCAPADATAWVQSGGTGPTLSVTSVTRSLCP